MQLCLQNPGRHIIHVTPNLPHPRPSDFHSFGRSKYTSIPVAIPICSISSMGNSNVLRADNKRAAFPMLGLLCLSLLLQKSGANEFTLGWTVPDASTHFDQWAQNNRFQIGDSIVFTYSPGQDSVLRVSQDDYTNCNTDAAAEKFSDGHSVFKFNQSGPFYFISGNKDNCAKNEKLIVIVLADRSQTSTATPPSPAPSGEASPPPPSPGTVQSNPTPAPESDQMIPPPPPSGASSLVLSFVGSIGAAAAYSSFLLF
ncbi:early nodulin-like protein 1 [Argentina anserina]|uniref:early nodulin-like protein 1 n=1 Tax=Argentina anserina TaxID=57926 RepID=UPI0021762968|nr:early nodulin-like protein 1 [Potentilla anserina]